MDNEDAPTWRDDLGIWWRILQVLLVLTALAVVAMGVAWYLDSRGPSTEEVAAQVKADIQAFVKTDEKLSPYRITVKDLSLIKTGDAEYRGIAKVRTLLGSTDHNVSVTVTHDGKDGFWELERGAFLFLADEIDPTKPKWGYPETYPTP